MTQRQRQSRMTNPIDSNDLLNQIAPDDYRVFRQLYNELLGYLEREEYDNIKEFMARMESQLAHAHMAQVALTRRLRNAQNDQDILKKTLLHQRFREPKVTMPITHPFPLAVDDVVADAPEPVNVTGAASTLEHDRKVDALMTEMAEYNNDLRGVNAQAEGMTMPVSAVDSALDDAATASPSDATILDSTVAEDAPDAPDKGERTDDLNDGTLFFTKGEDDDVDRAKGHTKKVQHNDPAASQSSDASESDDRSRKDRIWDYIKDDQSKGGIDHDL